MAGLHLAIIHPLGNASTQAAPSSSVTAKGTKLKLVKRTTVKLASFRATKGPQANHGKAVKSSILSALLASRNEGCEEDGNSSDDCGGGDDVEIYEFVFPFDSTLDASGQTYDASMQVLERVLVTGQRVGTVVASTQWGAISVSFDDLVFGAFAPIGIGENDGKEIVNAVENIKKDPKSLSTAKANRSMPQGALLLTVGMEVLNNAFPKAVHQDPTIVQFTDGKCAMFERYSVGNIRRWDLQDDNISCS